MCVPFKLNRILSYCFSWSCNLKADQCCSQSLLYLLRLLCNFKIKQGNLRSHLIIAFMKNVKLPSPSTPVCIFRTLNVSFCWTFSWSSKNLAAAIGVPVDVLHRRVNFWISKVRLLIFNVHSNKLYLGLHLDILCSSLTFLLLALSSFTFRNCS